MPRRRSPRPAPSILSERSESKDEDLAYRVDARGFELEILLGLEHQAAPKRTFPFRAIDYSVARWRRWLKEEPKPTAPRMTMLPLVLAVVVSQGPDPWPGPSALSEILDCPDELRSLLLPHAPEIRILVDDLGAQPEATLLARRATPLARLVLAFLKAGRDRNADVPSLFERHAGLVHEMLGETDGREGFKRVFHYTLEIGNAPLEALKERVARVLPASAREVIMTTADQLRAEGEAKGEAKGKAEGKARAVIQLLRLRFSEISPDVAARVLASPLAELRRTARGSLQVHFGRRVHSLVARRPVSRFRVAGVSR